MEIRPEAEHRKDRRPSYASLLTAACPSLSVTPLPPQYEERLTLSVLGHTAHRPQWQGLGTIRSTAGKRFRWCGNLPGSGRRVECVTSHTSGAGERTTKCPKYC